MSFYRFGATTKNEGLIGPCRILATRREKAERNSSDLARKLSGLGPGDAPLGGQRRSGTAPSWLGLTSGPGRGIWISTSNHRFKGGGRASTSGNNLPKLSELPPTTLEPKWLQVEWEKSQNPACINIHAEYKHPTNKVIQTSGYVLFA